MPDVASGLGPPPGAREPSRRPPARDPLSEAEVASIWEGQRYPAGSLATRDGTPVRVLYPGRRAGGAGPDYRDALVEVRGERCLGDVELHVRASSFRRHGHHTDPAYDRLVLHVVFLDDDGADSPLCSGARAPVAAFAPWVEKRSTDVAAWLGQPPLWQEPCRTALARLGEEGVSRELRRAGEERFAARVEQLRAEARQRGEEETAWAALLDALAYGGDRAGFQRLAAALPVSRLRPLVDSDPAPGRAARLESILIAVAGLGPAPEALGRSLPAPMEPPLERRPARPLNRPERRLAAAARLLAAATEGLATRMQESVRTALSPGRLVAAWQVGPGLGTRQALVGAARAAEIVLNAVLPLSALCPDLAPRALDLAAALPPLPPYGRTAFLERNLRSPARARPVRSALDQQGLLAYQARWCSQGGCGRCPLS